MASKSKSFTSVTVGDAIAVKPGESFYYSLSGTYALTAHVERSENAFDTYDVVAGPFSTANATQTGNLTNDTGRTMYYRWRCTARTSGTGVTLIRNNAAAAGNTVLCGSRAKVGGTPGFVVAAATNVGRMATCPASQSGSTLVVHVDGLKKGDIIEGFGVLGQIESAGGAVTLDAELRKVTPAAADIADASVGSITQVSVTADTAISSANAEKLGLDEEVTGGEAYYVLITATTAGSTDVDLIGVYVKTRPKG